MILEKIRLFPFGGVADAEIKFQSGLNVVLGHNEAGKSTVFHAIDSVLFTQSTLKKPEFERQMKRFIPLVGDTAQVELIFRRGDNSFSLSRSWGGTASSKLTLPEGAIVTDDGKIEDLLLELLPAKEGTFKSILMAYQSGLSTTFEALKNEYQETVHSLSDILMKAVLTTGGISVDRFKKAVVDMYIEYFSHWDTERQCPEKNRGISRPYKNDVGRILAIYYRKEGLRRDLTDVVRYEKRLDELNRAISEYEKIIEDQKKFRGDNEKLVKDIKERAGLESRLEVIKHGIKECKKDAADWPVIENKLMEMKKKLPELTNKQKALNDELKQARVVEKSRDIRKKFERLKKLKGKMDSAERLLKETPELPGKELEKIRNASSEVENLKTGIKAGELALKFQAKKSLSLNVQKDFEDEIEKKLKVGEELDLDAGGRIKVEHPDWALEIRSGSGDFEKAARNMEKAEKELALLLEKCRAASLKEAVKLNSVFETKNSDFKKAREIFMEELEDSSYEKIEQEVKNLGEISSQGRSLELIVKELADVENNIGKIKENIEKYEKKIKDYKTEYNTPDDLFSKLGNLQTDQKKYKNEMENLEPIPKGAGNAEEFIEKFEKNNRELEYNREIKNKADLERAEAASGMPDLSAEELADMLAEAEEEFEYELKRGDALHRIRELTERIISNVDENIFKSLESSVQGYIGGITENRYTGVEIEGGIPEGFTRKDGKSFSFDLLSFGTKDAFALAVRLSMADYFLKDASGFIVMDDPLVDLDPERQERAAGIIGKYAERKQLILFTCHPSHAELLGGNTLRLEGRV